MRLAARQAILPRFRALRAEDIEEKSPGETVTAADREAEALSMSEARAHVVRPDGSPYRPLDGGQGLLVADNLRNWNTLAQHLLCPAPDVAAGSNRRPIRPRAGS